MPFLRRTLVILVLLILGGLFGCSPPSPPSGPTPSDPAVMLVVENHNWADAVVYRAHPAPAKRLGEVTSLTTKRFIVPLTPGEPVVFGIELRPGGGRWVSPPVMAQDGTVVRIAVQNNLPLSNVAVR